MFSVNQHGKDSDRYDFFREENLCRWKGLFIPALKKISEQIHPCLGIKEDALCFLENLCLRILTILCAKPFPHTIQEIEEKVKASFPRPLDCWALTEAKEMATSKKKKSIFPADRIHTMLQKDVFQYKIENSISTFLAGILEYISADILKLAGNYVRKIKHCEILREDIEVAMCADKVFMDIFDQPITNNITVPVSKPLPAPRCKLSYEEVVKELIQDEKLYQRDLHMIIRVFREELFKVIKHKKDVELIFSNILDIYEVSVSLLGSLEDVVEISQEHDTPYIGSCFEELAEAEEFNAYLKYAQDITSHQSKSALTDLLATPEAMILMSAGHGFLNAVKYYLPKLLLVPIWHVFLYFDFIKSLRELSHSDEDRESFDQVQGLLRPLRCDLENIISCLPKETCAPINCRSRRLLAIERTLDLQNTVEHWDKDVGQNCNEFIREDTLRKLGSGKRVAERKVYLFDGLMILCKPSFKKQSVTSATQAHEYRLKEKFFIRRVDINDRTDTDEVKHAFEIVPPVQPSTILLANNAEHKNDWMADLIMINTKSMLDRILDSILLDMEKKHPLRLPSPEIYKFSVPDSCENIILEDKDPAGVPLIKGATLYKLIERLTYHVYADPMFVRTFLTTYRYFCSPPSLLCLLIERFNIPDPSKVYNEITQELGIDSDPEKFPKNSQREDWKRYRKEFVQPVQFRVLNVLRHWVDQHFYDFEKDSKMLEKLIQFLESVNDKYMRKWVDSVMKIVQRKNEQEESCKQITFAYGHSPPPIEYHLKVPDNEVNLLTLHPLELARQLTLFEFELYKNVKPSELVGSPWTKKDKEIKSPNLLRIMKHTTNVTRWFEKSIIEAENYEERVAVVTRAIEVMMVMLELNNFNGILSISAAMGSASVYRLKLTFQGLPARYEKFLEENRQLNDGHLKKYQEKLRSINPPCVPFFGRYLTNILHLEEGNPDFLPHTELINFSKRRKVAEIIGEIQQYQNQPYCLMVDPKIRDFLENLDPFKGKADTDISNYLYHESLRIEPKGCKQPPKFPRKWSTITLKSPGIKPRRQNNCNNSTHTNTLILPTVASFSPKSVNQIPQDGEQSPISASDNKNIDQVTKNVGIFDCGASTGIQPKIMLNSHISKTQENFSTIGTIASKLDDEKNIVMDEKLHLPRIHKNSLDTKVILNASNCANENVIRNSAKQNKQKLLKTDRAICDEIGEFYVIEFLNKTPPSPVAMPTGHPQNNQLKYCPFQSEKQICVETDGNFSISNKVENDMFLDASCLNCCTSSPIKHLPTYNSFSSSIDLRKSSDNQAIPISPHVNVPATHQYIIIPPPPLPPRKRDGIETSAHFAQKRQTPDAPLLPPRDDEQQPPPIPPKSQHSMGTSKVFNSDTAEQRSLLLPNTSSIMKRRNSAIRNKSLMEISKKSEDKSKAEFEKRTELSTFCIFKHVSSLCSDSVCSHECVLNSSSSKTAKKEVRGDCIVEPFSTLNISNESVDKITLEKCIAVTNRIDKPDEVTIFRYPSTNQK